MKIKKLLIEAEEDFRLRHYGLTEAEYDEYVQEYNQYLIESFKVPTTEELDIWEKQFK